ncbi:MAG: GDSL-type esterase/lipase family protein [Desulfosporosinus sp.]|nr:GDSL-type esterase/lipase family protein [Desulfosporosinus sp.]
MAKKKYLTISSLFLSLILIFAIALPVFAKALPAQQNVPVNKEWKITFSQPVDSSTLQDNISLDLSDGTSFSISPSVDPNDPKVVIVKHSLPFTNGVNYKLSVNPGIKSLSGQLLSDSTTLSFLVTTNVAVTGNNYVALGDSIACDISVSPGKGYVDLFYNYLKNQPENTGTGMELDNLAISGYTSTALLTQLQESNVQQTINKAKVITISIGSNNLLKPTIAAVAAAFGLNPQDPNFASDLNNKLSDPSNLAILLNLMSPENLPKSLTAGVTQFTSDWSKIITTIRTLAPNAQVYAMTLYNPLIQDNTVDKYIFGVYDPYIQDINTIIKKSDNEYKVVDVYPLFLNNQGDPVTGMSLLDPHPTDKGHNLIYQAHISAMITP